MTNSKRGRSAIKRVGRGPGSGKGKTCGRGYKGAGSRSGYKRRWGYEGGQMRLHMKLPNRGFSNVRFQQKLDAVNLAQIEKIFNDGDTVSLETLKQHGIISGKSYGIKILGNGDITKKDLKVEAQAFSASAREKLEKAKATLNEIK